LRGPKPEASKGSWGGAAIAPSPPARRFRGAVGPDMKPWPKSVFMFAIPHRKHLIQQFLAISRTLGPGIVVK